MSNSCLVLSFPKKNVSALRKYFSGYNSVNWVYLGKDFISRRHISRSLGDKFKYIDISRLHNEVADDIRHEHVQWIDELNRIHGSNLEWWFGTISSRNVYSSNLFQYCCYMEILEKLWTNQEHMPDLVFIESTGLLKTIQKWASRKDVNARVVGIRQAKLINTISYIRSFLGYCKFALALLFQWISAYITRGKYKINYFGAVPSIIVDTFVHDDSLSDDGSFKDRYYPYLHEYLSARGIKVIIHPILYGFMFNYSSIYKRMRQSKSCFIIKEDYLHLSDYLLVLTYPVRTLKQDINAKQFRSYDMSDILKEEKRIQQFSGGMQAVLVYRLFIRLGEAGLQPVQIICWYENQVIDKALIAGARRAFPDAKIVGAQMFIHSPNFLNLFPSQSEVETRMTPDLLLETSQYQCNVAQSFTKEVACMPAAALRCSYIFNKNDIKNIGDEQKKHTILVLLPFNINESVEMLEILKESLDQIGNDMRILIKTHPDYESRALIRAFGKRDWPERFEIYRCDLQNALNTASVMISSNSGTMAEAASMGIPIIFLCRQTALNQNRLSNIKMGIIEECFTSVELIEAIYRHVNQSSDKTKKYKDMGSEVRELFFTPVNKDTMSPFLVIDEGIHVP